ncbi:hypothetical protein DL93DRAFT_2078738 [Clavulina sp. PMI_390]|nr:hypothetical protein DL93DRAFT_2078738 [Clavulina sp. PMI_390]
MESTLATPPPVSAGSAPATSPVPKPFRRVSAKAAISSPSPTVAKASASLSTGPLGASASAAGRSLAAAARSPPPAGLSRVSDPWVSPTTPAASLDQQYSLHSSAPLMSPSLSSSSSGLSTPQPHTNPNGQQQAYFGPSLPSSSSSAADPSSLARSSFAAMASNSEPLTGPGSSEKKGICIDHL